MKISSTKLFEVNQLSADIQPKVMPLIGFINGLADEVIRALQKKLTFQDNVESETIQLKLVHDQSAFMTVREPHRVTGIVVLRTHGEARDAVLGINWQVLANGAIDLRPHTARQTKLPVTCTLLVLYG